MHTNRLVSLFLMTILFQGALADSEATNSAMTISSTKSHCVKMPLLLGIIGSEDPRFISMGHMLSRMLDRKNIQTVGFNVSVRLLSKKPKVKEFHKEFPIALFVSISSNREYIEWRLYDTRYEKMVHGKRFACKEYSPRLQAEHIADQIWPLLTGQEGFFSTRIAFCKEVKGSKARGVKQICLIPPYADSSLDDYSLLQEVAVPRGKVFAPRWNTDPKNPLLLYSESTLSNVRLMSVDLHTSRKIVSNFEGLNILPTFSSDGNDVVYCISRGGKSQLYRYHYDASLKKPALQQLTHNDGNNISPTLCHNGDIIFCSDFKKKGPQICYYHHQNGDIEMLTKSGYCACPSYCEKSGLISYCKLVDGVMQLFVYSLAAKTHEQLTFDAHNKEECTWSPCGNFLAYTVDDGKTNRIALYNYVTKEHTYLTSVNEYCTYPAWSPNYQVPLIVS